jgi:hypothetical protein
MAALADDKRKRRSPSLTLAEAERVVSEQVPQDRRDEIYEYLKLFGYKPDRTIIQVHIAGFFNKRRALPPREAEKKQAAEKRYGGTTFVVVGRTHDPAIMELVASPRKKRGQEPSPGYVGYLWKNKDSQTRAPHEVIPLDFTPSHVGYPADWKAMFATKGFMLAMHVPSSFAKDKSRLTRALYRAGKGVDVKNRWDFLEKVKSTGYGQAEQEQDPLQILKVRLAKGEISEQEYEKLWKTLAA